MVAASRSEFESVLREMDELQRIRRAVGARHLALQNEMTLVNNSWPIDGRKKQRLMEEMARERSVLPGLKIRISETHTKLETLRMALGEVKAKREDTKPPPLLNESEATTLKLLAQRAGDEQLKMSARLRSAVDFIAIIRSKVKF